MRAWKYSTDQVQGGERERLWQDALRHISLPTTYLRDHAGFHGEVSSVVTPSGIELSRVSSSAQTLSGACVNTSPCLWLALPIQGKFLLDEGSDDVDLAVGDILYGPTGCDSTLKLADHFVMLYIRIPQKMLYPRLLNLQIMQSGLLRGKAAVNRIFAGLLQSIVKDLEELDDDDIRPIEVAISEFVISGLAENAASSCFDVAGASNFRRISQAIELQLGDGDLTLHRIAEQQCVSARYIQKLFQQAGISFSHYLRRRRLEHCHSDLASAAHRHLSISEICFRWGFNDAAHFSRSFGAEYGMTPRAYRQMRLNEQSHLC